MDSSRKPTMDRMSVPSVRQLIAEIDERIGAALDQLSEAEADDPTGFSNTDRQLLSDLEDWQAVISGWQAAKGYI